MCSPDIAQRHHCSDSRIQLRAIDQVGDNLQPWRRHVYIEKDRTDIESCGGWGRSCLKLRRNEPEFRSRRIEDLSVITIFATVTKDFLGTVKIGTHTLSRETDRGTSIRLSSLRALLCSEPEGRGCSRGYFEATRRPPVAPVRRGPGRWGQEIKFRISVIGIGFREDRLAVRGELRA